MDPFFASEIIGRPFVIFSPSHLMALGFLLLINFILLSYRNSPGKTKNNIRVSMAITLWVNEIAWHVWNAVVGKWTLQTMLPLHLCSLLVWMGGLMLVTKSYKIYEFMYFLGIGGAMQALATPDLGIYGFPHFRFFQTFISHGLIVTSAVYMTVVEGLRPTWKSILRVFAWINLYMIIVYFINLTIGSNYLMLNSKPNTPSLLDLLPDWPVYIIYMEAIGVATSLLLFIPIAISGRRAQEHSTN